MMVSLSRCNSCAAIAVALLAIAMLAGPATTAAETGKPVTGPAPTQGKTPRVKVAPSGWALQGRVYNAQSQPVAGYSVFFVDASGRYVPQFGFAYTDSSGYFLLNYAGGNGHPSATPQIFIEVTNAASAPVYHASSPFQPRYGTVIFQSITLPNATSPKRIK